MELGRVPPEHFHRAAHFRGKHQPGSRAHGFELGEISRLVQVNRVVGVHARRPATRDV